MSAEIIAPIDTAAAAEKAAEAKAEAARKAEMEAHESLLEEARRFGELKKLIGGNRNAFSQFLEARKVFAAGKESPSVADDSSKAQINPGQGNDDKGKTGNDDDDKEKKKEVKEQKAEHKAAIQKVHDDNKLNLGFTDQSAKEIKAPARPSGLATDYVAEPKWDDFKTVDAESPNQLDAKQWNVILSTNKVLYGWVVREKEGDVVRARLPAFRISQTPTSISEPGISIEEPEEAPTQPEAPEPAVASATTLSTSSPSLLSRLGLSGQLRTTTADAGTSAVKAGPEPKPKSKRALPEFEVCDASEIKITEIKSDLQTSLANNSFSTSSIEGALSGGPFGSVAGISAGVANQTSTGSGQTDVTVDKNYVAFYNFPRVKLFLDEYNLELHPACAEALKELQSGPTTEGLRVFYRHFGHTFATEILLGGQLKTSKLISATSGSSTSSQRDAFKASVAASFSMPYVSASTKGSYEDSGNKDKSQQRVDETSKVFFTASGGNTLLSANPARWAESLSKHSTWRVLEQTSVEPIYDLLGRFKNLGNIPKLFQDIARTGNVSNPAILNNDKGWTGKIRLRVNSERLGFDLKSTNKRLAAVEEQPGFGAVPFEPVFTVCTGLQVASTFNPKLTKELHEDASVILSSTDQLVRSTDPGAGVRGLSIDISSGELVQQTSSSAVTRFSFRRTGTEGTWDDNRPVLKNGDKVELYCHSAGIGPYVSKDPAFWPVQKASRVFYHPIKKVFAVGIVKMPLLKVERAIKWPAYTVDWDTMRRIDSGQCTNADQDAYKYYRRITALDSTLTPDEHAQVKAWIAKKWYECFHSNPDLRDRLHEEKVINELFLDMATQVNVWRPFLSQVQEVFGRTFEQDLSERLRDLAYFEFSLIAGDSITDLNPLKAAEEAMIAQGYEVAKFTMIFE